MKQLSTDCFGSGSCGWARPSSRLLALAACVTATLCAGGCSTPQRSILDARQSFYRGDATEASLGLQQIVSHGGRFSEPADLDLAIVELATGNHRSAERRLRTARDRFDARRQFAVSREALSLVTDDTARAYHPAGYEEVMIRAMLAVCSLAGDGADAESYGIQATTRQQELERLARDRGLLPTSDVYQPIALAPYLRGVLREATHNNYDDAARAYRLVSHVQPDFLPASDDLARALGGTHSDPGHGVLYVFACVGRGPQLIETTAPVTSTALTIASTFVAEEQREDEAEESGRKESRELLLPNIASVKVPRVEIPDCPTVAAEVRVNGQSYGATQALTHVGVLAQRQHECEMPWTIARAVLRRGVKEAAVASARQGLGVEGQAGQLFQFAAATAWSATENADTRCWGLLPREIQVMRAELPVGSHNVAVTPLDVSGRPTSPGARCSVSIEDGRNRYLVAIALDRAVYLTGAQ